MLVNRAASNHLGVVANQLVQEEMSKKFITSATQRLEFFEVSMTVDKFVFSASLSLVSALC